MRDEASELLGGLAGAEVLKERLAFRDAITAFGDVAAALGHTRDRDDLLRIIGRKLCELVGVPRCSVYLRDESTGLYHGQVGHADHDIDALVKRLTCGTDADGFTREIIATQAPVVINNAATDPRPVKSTMRAWHVVSMMGVPMVLGGEVIGIVFLDSEERSHTFTSLDQLLASAFAELAAVAIAQAKLTEELRVTLETVARQNRVMRQASAVDDRLTGLVLDGRNMREIAEMVTDLTNKPCAIHDAEGRRLASGSPATDGEPQVPRLLEPEFVDQPEIAEALAALTDKKAAVVGPFLTAGLPYRFLVAPVTVRDIRWGTLVLMEQGSGRLNGFDMLLTRRTATIIALELSAERRAANAEWNARASLAGDLIRGSRDHGQFESRAQYLGMALDRPHVLALISRRSGDERPLPDARTAAGALRDAAGQAGVVASGVAEGIVVIAEAAPELSGPAAAAQIKESVQAACRVLDPDGHLIAGLSTVCRAPMDYPRAYAQAQQVIQCLDMFDRQGALDVVAADDLGAGRLFLASADAAAAERFTQETLSDLLEEPAAEMLVTLACFFSCGRSVRQSASHMGVHENTIRYRMSRVDELTGLPISTNSDAQLSAHLALTVLRLQGRLPDFDPPA